jgi:hypothetical protein
MNAKTPCEYDAVLGGQASTPLNAAVLGGLLGVKNRLASPVVEVRIASLSEAMKYGEAGLDLVRIALRDKSMEVKVAAYLLLDPSFTLEIETRDCRNCVINTRGYIYVSKEQEWTKNGEFLEKLYVWCVQTTGAIYACENGIHQSAFGYKSAFEAAYSLVKNYEIIGISPRGNTIFKPTLKEKPNKPSPKLKGKTNLLKQALVKSGVIS